MKRTIIIISLILITKGLYTQSGSIGISDSRSVGLGKTYTATSRGVFSVGYNPANLIFSEDNHFEFATLLPLPSINLRVGTNFITIKDYNYFFGGVKDVSGNTVGRYLTQEDKSRLLSIFESGGLFITDASVSILSVTYKVDDKIGAFGFGINDMLATKINFPRQLIELGLTGNPEGKIFNFNDAEAKAWWLRSYSLTYSRAIPEFAKDYFKQLSAGISLKYVQGFAYTGTDMVETSIETGEFNQIKVKGNFVAYSSFSDDFQVKYDFDSSKIKQDADISLFPSPAGNGFGIDFGLSAQLDEVWTFGLAVTDIGSISWDKNVAKYSSNTAIILNDPTDEKERDSLKDAITGKGEFIEKFNSQLPTALRLGVAFQLDKFVEGNFPGSLLIACDYNQGFNNQPRNSTKPRFSIGAEWKPMDWIPFIRTGFSFGGEDNFGWAFGIGINAGLLEFNFASPDFHSFFMANQAKRISLSIDSKWKF